MSFLLWYSLVFSVLVLAAQIFWPRYFQRKIRLVFGAFIFGLVVWLLLISWAQYKAWASGAPTKFLLPPYQSINYFLSYVGWRFFAPFAVSLAAALAFFNLAIWYNKRHGEEFFYHDEIFIMTLGIFLTGHPLWLLYLLAMALLGVGITNFRWLILRKRDKFSLYYFWLPVAAFVILVSGWLYSLDIFLKLKL